AIFSCRLYNSSCLQLLNPGISMKLDLDQLEAKIQSLIESQLTGILPGIKLEDRIIQKLAMALKQNVIDQKDKGAIAPTAYKLIVSKNSAHIWNEPRILETFINIITTAGRD